MSTTPNSPTFELTCELIRRESVTPEDAGCQALIAERLEKVGFEIEYINFGDVLNLYATYTGDEPGPSLMMLGHTDVVPSGPAENWKTPPFEPTIVGDMLHGRGTADMKTSVAAFVTAAEAFATSGNCKGRLTLLLTSDEEGAAVDGVRKVVEVFAERNEPLDYCLVGEPSSTSVLGDTIKNGRRGSLSGTMKVLGTQGHVAYPHLAENPIHTFAPALAELSAEVWDEGNDFFPPTSFQVSNYNAGTGANNVIPGEVDVLFNFRFCTEVTPEQLRQRTHAILDKHNVRYELDWWLSGEPFLTASGELVDAAVKSVEEHMGHTPELSTAGGTSDGRFIAPLGAQVLELGTLNKTIHQVDECLPVADIDKLHDIYLGVITRLLRA